MDSKKLELVEKLTEIIRLVLKEDGCVTESSPKGPTGDEEIRIET